MSLILQHSRSPETLTPHNLKARRTRAEIDAAIPAHLPHLLENILTPRVGEALAISKAELVAHIRGRNYRCNERSLRAAIHLLRRQQMLICSGVEGYWVASGLTELDEFIECELRSDAYTNLETARIMEIAGRKQFGAGEQIELFSLSESATA